jgi:hypothetical protein
LDPFKPFILKTIQIPHFVFIRTGFVADIKFLAIGSVETHVVGLHLSWEHALCWFGSREPWFERRWRQESQYKLLQELPVCNDIAERAIRTIMSVSRAMLIHAAIHWPDVADSTRWPMAVAHAVFLHNNVPSLTSGLSPLDVFGKIRWEQLKHHDLHVWGCPTYVLDKQKCNHIWVSSQQMFFRGRQPFNLNLVAIQMKCTMCCSFCDFCITLHNSMLYICTIIIIIFS